LWAGKGEGDTGVKKHGEWHGHRIGWKLKAVW
jgi:hypothetical protein